MKKNFKNILKDFNEFFEKEPDAKLQSWSLLNDFYNILIKYMEMNSIKRTQLAEKLGVSRSAISQLFNKSPNISLNKISEIAIAIGLRIKISSDQIDKPKENYLNLDYFLNENKNTGWSNLEAEKPLFNATGKLIEITTGSTTKNEMYYD